MKFQFRLSEQRDSDIIYWLNHTEDKSEAIRSAIRAAIEKEKAVNQMLESMTGEEAAMLVSDKIYQTTPEEDKAFLMASMGDTEEEAERSIQLLRERGYYDWMKEAEQNV